jgi:hypothetical protein
MPDQNIVNYTNVNNAQSATLPVELREAVANGVLQAIGRDGRIRQSRFKRVYIDTINKGLRSNREIVLVNRSLFADPQWNSSNTTAYVDKYGVPYRKDGSISVVIAQSYEKFTFTEGAKTRNTFSTRTATSFGAEVDTQLLRIVIHPSITVTVHLII